MDVEEKIKLVLKRPTEEVLTVERLKEYLEQGIKIKHYIGYEISGYLHIGSMVGILKVVDFQKAGFETEIFLADWHSWINNKLGGDLELIRRVAKGYFIKTFEKLIEIFGGDPEKTKFVLASEIYDNNYWALVLKIAKELTLSRTLRSLTIMGRRESESVPTAWVIYPVMQAADIFFQQINLAHGGIDQRKIHVITIEIGDKFGYKPIAVHHHLLTNLRLPWEIYQKLKSGEIKEGKEELSELKMSKSIPGSTIYIHASEEEIKQTIRKAFCPKGEIEFNPIWEIVEYIIFREDELKEGFRIINEKTGEEKIYYNLNELKKDWIDGKIHPLDLKNAVAEWLIEKLRPLRKFYEGPGKKYLEELKGRITR